MGRSKYTVHSLEDLELVAQGFAEEIKAKPFCVVTLTGDLAAGKTTFVQMIAKYLGVEEHVQSPTYAILRSYPLPQTAGSLHHMDLYRVEDPELLATYGILELLEKKRGIFFIEWPEHALNLFHSLQIFPIQIHIAHEDEERSISIQEED